MVGSEAATVMVATLGLLGCFVDQEAVQVLGIWDNLATMEEHASLAAGFHQFPMKRCYCLVVPSGLRTSSTF